jgi:alpha-L-fucosidase
MRTGAALASLSLLMLAGCGQPATQPVAAARYEADWESLKQHPDPDWLLDAKIGIYAHWGVYSVPAFSTEWYGTFMYEPALDRGSLRRPRPKTSASPAKATASAPSPWAGRAPAN